MYLNDILESCRDNIIISDMFTKANQVINNSGHNNIVCYISGGSDSDIILDAISKIDYDKKVKYVWFDTGLEYQATKNHLLYLENRYNIDIQREKSSKPIPLSVKQYGQPFLNKFVSENIGRLQKYNFKWEDKSYEELCIEYPDCKSAISWWCSHRDTKDFGYSFFNINYNQYLKEFLIANNPTFKISSLCCDQVKKNPSHKYIRNHKCDCAILGVRKSEGGIRQLKYTNCYETDKFGIWNYRPILWFENKDKLLYNLKYNIVNSDCYTKYGFTRTGCCCCPYGRDFINELDIIRKFEPQLYKAVTYVFKDSYEYTKQYRDFVKQSKDLSMGRKRLF